MRNPAYKFTCNSLGHEIAHLVMRRFYPNGIPRWLDEGFAQYVSKNARASYQRARGYIAKTRYRLVANDKVIPLGTFVTMTYPTATEDVSSFYDQSERLVRFLAAQDKPSFLALLDALARHQPFEASVLRYYSGKFFSLASLEEQFRAYASEDSESTVAVDASQ